MATTVTDQRYTLDQANSLLPLLHSIATEIQERRQEQRRLARLRDDLQAARTPEGLLHGLVEIDARLRELQVALRESMLELEELGVELRRLNPLTIHIQGTARSGDLVFCWQLGEESILYGHPIGEEEAKRRPLHLRLAPSSDGLPQNDAASHGPETPLRNADRTGADQTEDDDDLLPPDEHAA